MLGRIGLLMPAALPRQNEVEEILVIVEIVGYDVFQPLVRLLARYPADFQISVNSIYLLL
ncbi:MAG: hypothetical protein ACLPN1_15845 [Dissulfurispiraceae bacterium]|jgi:hypothetical protein